MILDPYVYDHKRPLVDDEDNGADFMAIPKPLPPLPHQRSIERRYNEHHKGPGPGARRFNPNHDELGRFSSGDGGGSPVDRWKDPGGTRPGGRLPDNFDSLTLDEQSAYFDKTLDARRAWDQTMAQGVAVGAVSPQEAIDRGWDPNVPPLVNELGGITNKGAAGVEVIPPETTLYHATTAMDAVLGEGFRTRDEIGAGARTGLGGGQSDTISFTTRQEYAQTIADAELGLRNLLNAPSTASLIEQTRAAGYEDQLHRFAAVLNGSDANFSRTFVEEKTAQTYFGYITMADWEAKNGPGWTPVVEDGRQTYTGADGVERYSKFERPMNETERNESRYQLYNAYLYARSEAGQGENPVFFGPNLAALKAAPVRDIGVIEAHAIPGAHGYQVPAEYEWRTWSGQAVRVTGRANPHGKTRMVGVTRYSPDQARDDHGRWTSDGGDSATTYTPEKPLVITIGTRYASTEKALRDAGIEGNLNHIEPHVSLPIAKQLATLEADIGKSLPAHSLEVYTGEVFPPGYANTYMSPDAGAFRQTDLSPRDLKELLDREGGSPKVTIGWNTGIMVDDDTLNRYWDKDVSMGFHPATDDPASFLAAHEYGHAINDLTDEKAGDYIHNLSQTVPGFAEAMGGIALYARANEREGFSEAYAVLTTGLSDRMERDHPETKVVFDAVKDYLAVVRRGGREGAIRFVGPRLPDQP